MLSLLKNKWRIIRDLSRICAAGSYLQAAQIHPEISDKQFLLLNPVS